MDPVPGAGGDSSGAAAASSAALTPSLLLSPTERHFLVQGIRANLRNDGRGCLDYRSFHLSTSAVPHAAGSARIRLDGTDVLVAVTLDITPVHPDHPNIGIALCSVDFAASAGLSSSSPASPLTAVRLSDALQGLYVRSGCIDLSQLCILPGSQCWTLFLDALVISSAGNLLSAISLASLAALLTTSLPSLSVLPPPSPTLPPEITITDDPPTPLHNARLPIAVSMHGFQGDVLVLDATVEEEEGGEWEVGVGVDEQGRVVWMGKGGRGAVKAGLMKEILRVGRKAGREMNGLVRSLVKAQQRTPSASR